MAIEHKFLNIPLGVFSFDGLFTENGILKCTFSEPKVMFIGTFNPSGLTSNPNDFFHGENYFWPSLVNLNRPNFKERKEKRILSEDPDDYQTQPSLNRILGYCALWQMTFVDLVRSVLHNGDPTYTQVSNEVVNFEDQLFNLNPDEDKPGTLGIEQLDQLNQVEWNTQTILAFLIENPLIKSIYFTGEVKGIWVDQWNLIANHPLLQDRTFTPILPPTESAISSQTSPYSSKLDTLIHYWVWNGMPHPKPVNNPIYGLLNHDWLNYNNANLDRMIKIAFADKLYEQQYLEFSLTSGRKVRLDGFNLGITYGGLIEGTVDNELNEKFFQELTYPKNWGERKTLKIRPEESEFSTILKPYYCSAWLSSDPLDDGDGSELVIIWLTDRIDLPVLDLIREGVQGFDWNQEAEDWRL